MQAHAMPRLTSKLCERVSWGSFKMRCGRGEGNLQAPHKIDNTAPWAEQVSGNADLFVIWGLTRQVYRDVLVVQDSSD